MHFSTVIGSPQITYCLEALLRTTQIKVNEQKQLIAVSPPAHKKQNVLVRSKSMYSLV